ncbi:MAG: heme o synthase [Syntrophorhabdaceae bacterium]|nr:heme o synthase [Syntrophorhabdaceae bacterium]
MTRRIQDYIVVAKPGIITANMVTCAGGFFLASKKNADLVQFLAMMTGMCMIVASACIFNNYIDRDIDRRMSRTRQRPFAAGRIPVKATLITASGLCIAGGALLAILLNARCAMAAAAGFMIYVCVYSLYLKRGSRYSVMVGSLAGAAPPVAGYLAVRDEFDAGAVILSLIFILWQIPHSYAVQLYHRDDYEKAAIPVLPARKAPDIMQRHMIIYILGFSASVAALASAGYTGTTSLVISLASAFTWLYFSSSRRTGADEASWARRMFVLSIIAIISLSIVISLY